jgi:hypothetical protein
MKAKKRETFSLNKGFIFDSLPSAWKKRLFWLFIIYKTVCYNGASELKIAMSLTLPQLPSPLCAYNSSQFEPSMGLKAATP